ncbi:MAG: hypothetical protein MK132_24260 [Lentisphaerales bacterium]|nr:hypothetical protein [Lentisphaerales bacterium]
MQVNFNPAEIAIFQLPETPPVNQTNSFNLSNAILDLQNINSIQPDNVGVTRISSETISEKQRILQRALNLQDAASTLLNHLKSNGSTLSGSLARDTSETSLKLALGEEENTISSVSNLSNLSSGTFQINGMTIAVDIDKDSILDVLERANNASTGTQLSYNYSDQTVSISSLNKNLILLQNGSSNFFSGLNLHEGYISGDLNNNEEAISVTPDTQLHFKRFTSRFNRLMNSNFDLAKEEDFRDTLAQAAKNSVRNFIDNNFSSGDVRLESDVRMSINSQTVNFLNSTISFEDNDSPISIFNFLSSAEGILSPFVSLTNSNNTQLKESLTISTNNSLIISTEI